MGKYLDFTKILEGWHLTGRQIEIWNGIFVALILVIASVIAFYITRFIISKIIFFIISKSHNDYDDLLLKNRVFEPIAHIVPALILLWGLPYITSDHNLIAFLKDSIFSYLLIALLVVIFRLLNALNDFYEIIAVKKNLSIHIKQYLQVIKILLVITVIILIISIIFDKKPGALLAGLGAMTAVLMLIFKDSILSLVASIQISAYDLVKVGDWITVPSKGVDGDVMDISLNTIKIRNFDKTISTIPTYMIVQEPFINWRGMVQTGGRRIKRSINIDVNSIKLCDDELLEKLKKIQLLKDYIEEKQKEISQWNKEHKIDEPTEINGRGLTNLGVFRKYIENYLRSNLHSYKKYRKETFEIDGKIKEFFVIHDKEEFLADLDEKAKKFLSEINGKTILHDIDKFLLLYSDKYVLQNGYLYKIKKIEEEVIVNGVRVNKVVYEKIVEKPGLFCDDLTLLVRQLTPTDKGVPIEVYTFAATTEWGKYENIQGDLFDHLFAIIPHFELRVYQQPSSNDFLTFTKSIASK